MRADCRILSILLVIAVLGIGFAFPAWAVSTIDDPIEPPAPSIFFETFVNNIENDECYVGETFFVRIYIENARNIVNITMPVVDDASLAALVDVVPGAGFELIENYWFPANGGNIMLSAIAPRGVDVGGEPFLLVTLEYDAINAGVITFEFNEEENNDGHLLRGVIMFDNRNWDTVWGFYPIFPEWESWNFTILEDGRPGPIPYKVRYTVIGSVPATHSPGPSDGIFFPGDAVTVQPHLTTTVNYKIIDGQNIPGTWTFSGWETEDATVIDNEFVMPNRDVVFTGKWTFTPDELAPRITITKSVNHITAQPGSTLTYTITLNNIGTAAGENIRVTDELSPFLTFVPNSVQNLPSGATFNFTAHTRVLEVLIPVLNAGETLTFTFQATVNIDSRGNAISNVAVLFVDGADGVNSNTVTVTVPALPGDNRPGPGPGGGGGGRPVTPSPVIVPPQDDPPDVVTPFAPKHHAYIVGFPDGYVRPQANITRAQTATIFFRLIADSHRAEIWTQQNPFYDVYLENWFNNAVSTMANDGVLLGFPDGTFAPNQYITRAEFAAIVSRFLGGTQVYGASFYDVGGHWAESAIRRVSYMGWVLGYEDGTFRPDRFITRAETTAVVNRILGRLPESYDDLLYGMLTWPDNSDQNAWYYLHIQEATNSHYHEMKDDGIHERWTGFFPAREWTVLERPYSQPEHIFVINN